MAKIQLYGEEVELLKPTIEEPSLEELQEWVLNGECEATDGCWVEPDGICNHGYVSWLLYLGLM